SASRWRAGWYGTPVVGACFSLRRMNFQNAERGSASHPGKTCSPLAAVVVDEPLLKEREVVAQCAAERFIKRPSAQPAEQIAYGASIVPFDNLAHGQIALRVRDLRLIGTQVIEGPGKLRERIRHVVRHALFGPLQSV